jgi:hypothetical protein
MVEQGSIEYLKAFGTRRNRRKAFREMLAFRTRLSKDIDPNARRHDRRRLAKETVWPKLRFPIVKPSWGWAGVLGLPGETITPVISQDVNDPPPRQIELAGDFIATADEEPKS